MSTPRQNFPNAGHFYNNTFKPLKLDLAFTVAATNGLGVTSLKSNGYVNNVFMHTSTTPTANNGFTNPNPAVGIIAVQLKQNFNVFLGSETIITAINGTPVKTDNNAMTVGGIYTISTLGNETAARWLTLGVPVGVTPAVGVTFIALSQGGTTNTSTSRVAPPATQPLLTAQMVGSPILTNNTNVRGNAGLWLFFQTLGATASGDVTLIPTAPAAGAVVSMSLFFDQSSVTVDGL